MKKSILTSVIALMVIHAGQTWADVSLPLNCTGLAGESQLEMQIQADYRSATISDHGDVAILTCQFKPDLARHLPILNCLGEWISDASEAKLNIGLFTFVAMPTVKRSQGTFGGEMVSGVCH